jgi:glycosyltransferase involved in cell wall biosynthesis
VGIPVIASRTGGIPEAVEDGGLFVDNKKDPKEIAEKILTDKELYEKLREKALRRVKKFDNLIITRKFIQLYRDALTENHILLERSKERELEGNNFE